MSDDISPLLALDDGTQNVMLDLIGVARNNMNAPLQKPGKAVTRVLRESVKQERPVVYTKRQAIMYGVLEGQVSDRYGIDEILEEASLVSFKCTDCGEVHAPSPTDKFGDDCGKSNCDGEYLDINKIYFGKEVDFSDE